MNTGKLLPLRRVTGQVTELSDEALLAACATGDTASLGALFDRFNVAVYRFVARLQTTDEGSPDDLVQATFLEVRRTAGRFRGGSSVKTWLLGVAANVARHQLRSERRRRVHQAKYLERLESVPAAPEEQVDRRRLLIRIATALGELPHDQQVAFILCDLEQLPGVEVARALEIPEGTLWRRLHHARKAMRASIDRSPR
ncbi:MAG: polymerase sigma-70 factor, subfamily [Myxococcales bacterium]|nr:polymerase sigma-70 factor, subfamily [Myxococcales bacterium]